MSGKRFAVWVAAGILLSKLSGLVRDRVFAHYLGNSDAAGAFKAALRIPNFLQNLFGEGVLSASFIPVYSKLLAQGDEEMAGRVAGIVGSLLAAAVSLITLVGVALTPSFVDLVAPGFEGPVRELTIQLVRILFPGVALLVLSAWCLGILNSHRKFFLSYAAPVLWNAAMIVALVVQPDEALHEELAIALAWGAMAGSLLQLGIQLPFVFHYSRRLRFSLQASLAPVRDIFASLGPVVMSRGVVQLSAYIDGIVASFLGTAAVSSLAYAQTLYLIPVGLFGMSVAAAELPEMSSSLGTTEEVHEKLRARLASGCRTIAFYVIPSVLAFLFIGRSLVAALFQTGRFGDQDTLFVWYILMGSVGGLLAATWARLYSSAFYALRDTRTPFKIACIRVLLTAGLGVLFAFPLRAWVRTLFAQVLGLEIPELPGMELGMGAVGLTLSSGVVAWIEFKLLQRSLLQRIGKVRVDRGFLVKATTAAGIASAAAGSLQYFWRLSFGRGAELLHLGRYDLRPVIVIGVFGAVYGISAAALGLPEARSLWKRVRR